MGTESNFEIMRSFNYDGGQFTQIPNAILRDNQLTVDAKLVLWHLLSLSGSYHLSMRGISSVLCMPESRVRRATTLLKESGYISIQKVRNGKLYGGYRWLISDTANFYRTYHCEHSLDEHSLDEHSLDEHSMDAHTNEILNNEYLIKKKESNEYIRDETSSSSPSPAAAKDKNEDEVNGVPDLNNSFLGSSSVADAPSLSYKSSEQVEVLTQTKFLYEQFLKKYPKKPYGSDLVATKQAFFEKVDSDAAFAEIMDGIDEWCNSVDWTKNDGQYIPTPLNFLLTRKWEEIPRKIKTEIDPDLLEFVKKCDKFTPEDYL